jgi:hypothetical protein
MGDRLQTGEPYKGLAGAAVSLVLYRIVRNWSNINSPRMGPGCPTNVLGKRSVPVELDYSITPGDWDKPLYGVLFWLWPHTTPSPQTNKQTNYKYCGTTSTAVLQVLRYYMYCGTTSKLQILLAYWNSSTATHLLGRWDIGTLWHWDVGMLGCWDVGTIQKRATDIYWQTNKLQVLRYYKYCGTPSTTSKLQILLAYWNSSTATHLLGHWDIGTLGRCDIGMLGCWDVGTLGRWD